MAVGVRVNVTDAAIISALNAPGGAVFEWRDDRMEQILAAAHALSPVNDPLNAVHRGGIVGTFQASWVGDRIGSNGHRVRANVENFADHAIFVEYGRSASTKYQRFSWTGWGGEIREVGRNTPAPLGTRAREGQYVLVRAVNAVGVATGDWAPLALR